MGNTQGRIQKLDSTYNIMLKLLKLQRNGNYNIQNKQKIVKKWN